MAIKAVCERVEDLRRCRDGFGAVLLRNFVECPAPPITCADVQSVSYVRHPMYKAFWLRAIATGAAFAKLGAGIRCDD